MGGGNKAIETKKKGGGDLGFPGLQCRRHRRLRVRFLSQEDPLEEGMTIHSSILTWRIPWTDEPGRLQPIGSRRVRCNWSNLARTSGTPPALITVTTSTKWGQSLHFWGHFGTPLVTLVDVTPSLVTWHETLCMVTLLLFFFPSKFLTNGQI